MRFNIAEIKDDIQNNRNLSKKFSSVEEAIEYLES
jgi:hypothetical protein